VCRRSANCTGSTHSERKTCTPHAIFPHWIAQNFAYHTIATCSIYFRYEMRKSFFLAHLPHCFGNLFSSSLILEDVGTLPKWQLLQKRNQSLMKIQGHGRFLQMACIFFCGNLTFTSLQCSGFYGVEFKIGCIQVCYKFSIDCVQYLRYSE